ncbi:mitochondrial ribosomal death-associated protein 3-domain-containing protein [Kockovaella imperatae]|uniref:Small ribosomal subunit protein mS29 n=1 Tax=Kockovaella imperatae TaxID=4999 RepID=A0A1Y1UAJ4_9TREE|nr:mitochondrial ribosomal death-associated protein 3-domain-containing protein [Kockovaella imperatae]ORX35071.1 mitochondrial ribosomal death-associated protein 3-domain-containing protein [Kockovaella imperatae]
MAGSPVLPVLGIRNVQSSQLSFLFSRRQTTGQKEDRSNKEQTRARGYEWWRRRRLRNKGVVEFSPERLMEDNVGLPTLFPVSTLGELKPFGLPRQLDKELTSYGPPASVVRYATLGMKHILESGASQSSEEARYLLTGHRGSGKSFLLLQTVCQALVNNWIVLYFPRTGAWIDSTFSYEYNAESQTFHQPSLALHILQTIASVNGSELSKIPSPNKDGTLADFIRKIKKEEHAVKGLEQVMTALASQTQVPVLLAMDDAHTLFATSKYRSPDYEKLRSYHMSTPLLMLDYLTARKTFNRGMVISALSYSDTVFYPSLSLEHGLGLESDRHLDPYDTIDPTHYAHATSGIKKIHLPYGMSTKEAAGMFEIWSRKGIVRRSTDETFMGTFAAAAGNPKEMRRGVHLTIQAYNYSPAGLHE